jgi:CheY-like chemotaxis protein/two-component sensor histidine kinase
VAAFARQKLESLGTLASGIAHDFNNLMGAVLAQAELAVAELAGGIYPHQQLSEIKGIALRGSEIVRQLMIYAGNESDVLELVDLSQAVEEMLGLVKSTISKNATLVCRLHKPLPAVKARPAQIRQILMNLVVNASDAIKGRDGEIRVTTEPVTLDRGAAALRSEGLAEGDYVRLEVSDTGTGMPHDVQARIFDPFFSTKAAGRGLGLLVVHGIVQSLHGAIRVTSEVGKGATFQILLPSAGIVAHPAADTVNGTEQDSQPRIQGTVLLVEDEGPLRFALGRMLGKARFTVLEAADGTEAVKLLRDSDLKIDLLFLDMTIPGCPSEEVLSEGVRARPELKVILTSAYSEEMVKETLSGPQVRGFVRKPFRTATVVSALRNALSS